MAASILALFYTAWGTFGKRLVVSCLPITRKFVQVRVSLRHFGEPIRLAVGRTSFNEHVGPFLQTRFTQILYRVDGMCPRCENLGRGALIWLTDYPRYLCRPPISTGISTYGAPVIDINPRRDLSLCFLHPFPIGQHKSLKA